VSSSVQPVVFIYDRAVSATAQSRVALHLRLRACHTLAVSQEWAIGGWYVDTGEEALSDNRRPALDRALMVLQREMPYGRERYLLVHDWDRLSRSPKVQLVISRRTRLAGGMVCTVAGPTDERARQGHARDLVGCL
jgi:DNA invertase Pin-like site-specific DNA recombinase